MAKRPSTAKGEKKKAATARSRATTKKAPLSPVSAADDRHRRFAQHYIDTGNATQAYLRTYPAASYATAGSNGHRLLQKAEIQALIAEEREKIAERARISQADVLKRLIEIATADANELIEYRRTCCRYCHGIDHQYQWRDEAEYKRAVQQAELAALHESQHGKPIKIDVPGTEGGFGYDPQAEPHPDCPECHGEGHGRAHIHDTRKLSPQARKLYRGVKITKLGIEVLMADQDAALRTIAHHLGMLDPKLTLRGDKENPLTLLIQQIGRRSAFPTARIPPEDEGA